MITACLFKTKFQQNTSSNFHPQKKKTQSANSKLLASERERNESLTENQPNSLFVNPPPLPSKYTAIVWWRALFPTRDVTENFHTTIAPIVLRAHKLDVFPFYSTFLQLSFNKKKNCACERWWIPKAISRCCSNVSFFCFSLLLRLSGSFWLVLARDTLFWLSGVETGALEFFWVEILNFCGHHVSLQLKVEIWRRKKNFKIVI